MAEKKDISEVIQKLDQLAMVRAELDDQQRQVNEIVEMLFDMHPEARDSRDAIRATMNTYQDQATKLESEIREFVVKHEESIKGSDLHAVFAKGKTSWDGAKLDGFAAAFPAILEFKKTGKPSVSIRKCS